MGENVRSADSRRKIRQDVEEMNGKWEIRGEIGGGGSTGRVRKMIGMGKSGRFVEGLGSGRRRMVGGKRQNSLEACRRWRGWQCGGL